MSKKFILFGYPRTSTTLLNKLFYENGIIKKHTLIKKLKHLK